LLIHPRDLFPANMMPAASTLPRPAVPEQVLVLEQVPVPGLVQVLVPELELELELEQVLEQALVPEQVLERHTQPPPSRSP